MVKVSVIIPTYNRANLIARSIESALNQTYRDFEILIVDDGSTDATFDAVSPFLKHPHVRYLRHEKNKGHQAARNTGVKNASGDYIAFLDSDDTWNPQKIELQLDAINKRGADCVVLTGLLIIENGLKTKLLKEYNGYVYPKMLAADGPASGALLLPRAWWIQIGFADESISAFADWEVCICLAKLFEFITVNELCVNYYQVAQNAIQKNPVAKARDYARIVEKHHDDMLRFIGSRGLAKHYKRIAVLYDDAGDFAQCRAYVLAAFRTDKWDPRTFLLVPWTLCGARAFHLCRQLVNIKQRVTLKLPII
jgi:glycosyltransferase involved in cell wall biosynthesis